MYNWNNKIYIYFLFQVFTPIVRMTTLYLSLRWLVRDILFRDHFLCFEFTNTKFQVYKLEISSLQTRNVNSKFRVCKLEISSL